ncbi:hypothetical protein HNU91_05345 [Neisseria meningitidis]|nr:hypothetical protein [Neisseria meningitidis]
MPTFQVRLPFVSNPLISPISTSAAGTPFALSSATTLSVIYSGLTKIRTRRRSRRQYK